MTILLTRSLAMAAARDAANKAMRADNRTAWIQEDYLIAVQTFNKLWKTDYGFDTEVKED